MGIGMSRRTLVGVGALASLVAVCPLSGGSVARGATFTSWDFSANADLSHEAIAERFEHIVRTYEVREPLSDEDADFVLRYALPAPVGTHATQVDVAAQDSGSGFELNGSARHEYLGNFVYRIAATLQVGSSESIAKSMSVRATHAVFGYAFPFDGASLSMFDLFERDESSQERHWFTTEVSNDTAGIAVALWQSYQATITTEAGEELSLKGAFLPDGL